MWLCHRDCLTKLIEGVYSYVQESKLASNELCQCHANPDRQARHNLRREKKNPSIHVQKDEVLAFKEMGWEEAKAVRVHTLTKLDNNNHLRAIYSQKYNQTGSKKPSSSILCQF